jgi:hypothetical protein
VACYFRKAISIQQLFLTFRTPIDPPTRARDALLFALGEVAAKMAASARPSDVLFCEGIDMAPTQKGGKGGKQADDAAKNRPSGARNEQSGKKEQDSGSKQSGSTKGGSESSRQGGKSGNR